MRALPHLFLPLLLLPILLSSCNDGTGVFLFSLEDDVALGGEVDAEIESQPSEFPILDRSSNSAAYAYLEAMKQDILDGGTITYADEFVWELHIIDDSVLNAFCTPGGYIYIYTGLINYLDDASSLAGVLGHEMAHADRRHSSRQMQQQYGISTLLSVITGGEPGLLANIAASLVQLRFSRGDESEADQYSVDYLCPTDFEADGASNFFQKIEDSGGTTVPEFLSTHPNPENRVTAIRDYANTLSCSMGDADPLINGITYDDFKALLP